MSFCLSPEPVPFQIFCCQFVATKVLFHLPVSGKGSFVSTQNKDFIQEEQLRIAEELLQKAAMIGRSYNISYEQMSKILLLFYEE